MKNENLVIVNPLFEPIFCGGSQEVPSYLIVLIDKNCFTIYSVDDVVLLANYLYIVIDDKVLFLNNIEDVVLQTIRLTGLNLQLVDEDLNTLSLTKLCIKKQEAVMLPV